MLLMIRSFCFKVFSIAVFAILWFAFTPAFAQEVKPVISVAGRQVALPSNTTAWLDSFSTHAGSPALVIIQFVSLPSAEKRAQLKAEGITIYNYLADRTYVAKVEKKAKKDAALTAGIRSIVLFDMRWKISDVVTQVWSSPKMVDILVSFLPDVDVLTIKDRIIGSGGSIKQSPLAGHGFYEVSLPGNKVVSLAQWYGVAYINAGATHEMLNLEGQYGTKANIAQASVAFGGWGLMGDSVTVGVGDNIAGIYHVDVKDRIINYNPAPPTNNHGQHVNGTVGGAGTIDPRGEGYAPHVNIVDNIYNLIWANTPAMYQAHNMTITNNSYSVYGAACANSGKYDAYAQMIDTIALETPQVLHLFAAGNSGFMTCPPFPAKFSTINSGYQEGKNVLTIGNIDKAYNPYHHTSRGPVLDGRLKPEICAIGAPIWSTNINETNYNNNAGTSMSTPAVAGSAALLQQHYKHLHSGVTPDAPLTKTLLMNGAMDMGNAGPDYTYGFGMLDVSHSLKMLDSGWHMQSTIANGATQTPLTITVPANTAQLKVMLYWHDIPASASSSTQLINDLDLKVTEPSSTIHRPLILNPAPANVEDPAIESVDHLNNVEQVVINNPAAGSYTVGVSGYSIPYGPQPYTLVYNIIKTGVQITAPFKGDAFRNNDSLRVYWNSSTSVATDSFTLEFSSDNGNAWTTLSNNINPLKKVYSWFPTGINSSQCLLRLTRNVTGQQSVSGLFTISNQPVISLNATQCPGYVNTTWTSVPNATGYNVLRKVGLYLQQVAFTTDTFYNAGGLSLDSTYYFTVQPVLGSATGFRAIAISRMPNTGTCSGTFSDGDLMMEKILSPTSGRVGTSTAMVSNDTLTVQIRNLDDAAASSYQIAYQVDANPWIAQTFSSFPANNSGTISFTGLNLAAAGSHTIKVAITNLGASDPIHSNDTLTKIVRQLQNGAVNLVAGFTDGFEADPALTIMYDTMGFTPDEHWDFDNYNNYGRLRTFVNPDVTIDGQRSISMDLDRNTTAGFNLLTGTFNLASYSTATDEVRMEFDYKLHGIPRYMDSNKVWVRGSDTQPWVQLYVYDTLHTPGDIIKSGTLSLNDALIAASQSFSTSTQIAFGQRDTSVISLNDYGNGLTLDNVKLYRVVNDIGITAIVSPAEGNCALGSSTPVTITVYNGVTATINNIKVYYQYDGGSVDSEIISSIAGKTAMNFTFAQTINAAVLGVHTLDVWLSAPLDSYNSNDSILNYTFRNEPLITSYPYLQNFENGDGYWYAEGHNSSWEFGTPSSSNINKAASGTKAWKTNLDGNYNDNELSYLYSPCFDISGLTIPMLSFSVNMQIENCGSALCDAAWVEYSVGGGTWTKLGANGQGTNWYNSTQQLWTVETPVRWRAASIPIPSAAQPVRFRIAFLSDPGTGYEGIAIDDIHVYDRAYPTYTAGTVGPVSQSISTPGYTSFVSNSRVLAQLNPQTANLGNTDVTEYKHTYIIDTSSSQYYLPRNFVVLTQNVPTDSVVTRLFISDADVLTLVNATGCTACSKPTDAYEMGITKFSTSNKSLEDGDLKNNYNGFYSYIPYTRIKWVPYDSGYYAEVKLASFSELWFNDGGPSNAFPLPIASVEFDARKTNSTSVAASWTSHVDTQVSDYELQRSENAADFTTIARVASAHDNSHLYSYTDVVVPIATQALYYRLKYVLTNGKEYYSSTRQVIWNGNKAAVRVYPNPSSDGKFHINWSTKPGSTLDASITDVTGRTIVRTSANAAAFSNDTELDIAQVAKGVYFLHCNVAGEQFEFKVVVQ